MQVRTAFGLGIESEFPFDALYRQSCEAPVRLEIKRVSALRSLVSAPTKLAHAQGRIISVVVDETSVEVRIAEFLAFKFRPSSDRIACEAMHVVPDDLLRYWFLQQIVPLYLLWNGSAEFLHGMSVSTGDVSSEYGTASSHRSCMAFLGDSYAGKSTLLSYFLSRNHALVSDDHLAVSRKDYTHVLPATPYYRPYRAGEDLGYVADNFYHEPVQLKRVFLLEPAPGYADIVSEEVKGIAAVAALLPHIQYNLHNPKVPQLFPLVEERFHGLNQLVRRVIIKRLYVPRAMDRLPAVYDFIQKEVAS